MATPGAVPARPSTSQPIDHATLSRNVASRPGAKKRRSMASSTSRRTTSPPSSMSSTARPLRVEEDDAEHGVGRKQLEALVPRRLAVLGDVHRDDDREEDRAELEAVEDERHGVGADEERDEHEQRSGEERDLRARADRDVHRED